MKNAHPQLSNHLNAGALQLLCQRGDSTLLLLSKTGLKLGNQGGKLNLDTLLLGVSVGQTHLLDTALASSELFLTENDTEGNGALFGGLELLGQLGLQLVGELSLKTCRLVIIQIEHYQRTRKAYLDTSAPQLLTDVHTLLQHSAEALTTEGHDVGIDLAAAKGIGLLLALDACLGDGEDTVDTE